MSAAPSLLDPFVASRDIPSRPPPALDAGPLAWLRRNLFGTWYDALLTALVAYAAFRLVPPFVSWALIEPVWGSAARDPAPAEVAAAYRAAAGACWAFVAEKRHLILFGLYPFGEEWRPVVAMLLMAGLAVGNAFRRFWGRRLALAWVAVILAAVSLMYGAVPLGIAAVPLPGLRLVETLNWGGLP